MDLYSVVCAVGTGMRAAPMCVSRESAPAHAAKSIGDRTCESWRLAARGIRHEPVVTYGNGVRHVVVLDPDGNSLALAEPPAQ